MAQDNPEQEPSIEEILASIRQIISDDDEEESVPESEPEAAPEPKAKPKPKPEPEPDPEPEEDDEVLELTDKLDESEEEEFEPEPERFEIDLADASEEVEEEDDEDDSTESIFTDTAKSAAFEGFSALASKTALDRKGTGATTIEDIVREMMKPMLREWLDVHLPPMIEKIVQRELRKVARRAMEEEE